MSTTSDRLVNEYLGRLHTELRDLPRERRREVFDDIAEHIAEARAELPTETEAQVRTMLDRVGEPSEIAAAEYDRLGEKPSKFREVAAIVLLLLGGFVFLVGWIFGVILLWASDAWTIRDKLIGTLIVPGGFATSIYVGFIWGATVSVEDCSGPQGGPMTCTSSGGGSHVGSTILAVALLAAPLATTVYLSLRMRAPMRGASA